MTVYADYQYYKDIFKGKTIFEKSDFEHAAILASQYIDGVTFGRIGSNVTDTIKNACCAAAEIYYQCDMSEAAAEAAGKSSEKVGDHSVTYAKSDFSYSSRDKQLSKAVKLWLGNTDLLYRGGVRYDH